MKLNGIFGTGSGKTGNAVFATSAGKQIVRTYQPQVTNPNTDAQVAQRAKFKLLSQLAAAMDPVIVIPKSGLVSARNRFVKKNIPLATYANDKASIVLTAIQLTDSNRPMAALTLSYGIQEQQISGQLNQDIYGQYSKIRYCLFKKTEDSKLILVASQVINTSETENPHGEVTFPNVTAGEYVVYGYGMSPKNASASVGYNNYDTEAGKTTADLETSLRISTYNYDFSATEASEIKVS